MNDELSRLFGLSGRYAVVTGGNSGIGESGNMGVGDITATLSIYSRRQKGRHVTF